MSQKLKFPALTTKRLTLSELKAEDIPEIVNLANNKNIEEYTLNIPHPYNEKDAIRWLNIAFQGYMAGTEVIFRIGDINSGDFMGGIGLKINKSFNHAELGYWIGEKYWGKGYISEAIKATLDYGFNELQLHKIFAHYIVGNEASGRVMEKNGMIKEAELKDHIIKNGKYISMVQYRLTIDEFKAL
ncbi:GNAT family N-acetyltransferase [Marinigracilibium pacificum]|uniref:GNAT family N-acetyltransferase n=1 Tax=Marinigracilibium pacificum TaxID=2729599 RepID=A0A848IZQ5_9BACT|nr:GNAT family N-acetyltransferase [Marinigracilibium pacificum]NMM47780.1 GNAT family N-acetyltransferase [Marinigracilibium pacificum]